MRSPLRHYPGRLARLAIITAAGAAGVALSLAPLPAAADQTTMLTGRMPSLSQGRPSPNARFAPAPVPNLDMEAPPTRPGNNEVALVPSLTRTETAKTAGDGFTPGSTFSGQMERRDRNSAAIGTVLAPSLKIRVPVQVDTR